MRLPSRTAAVGLAALAAVWCLIGTQAVQAQGASPSVMPSTSPAISPSPFCAILDASEVGAVIGAVVTVGSSTGTSCSYVSADGATLAVLLEFGDLATLIGAAPSGPAPSGAASSVAPAGQATTVAGQPAYVTPEGTVLYVQTGDWVVSFGALGFQGIATDVTAALISLASTAIPRLSSIAIPSAGPEASPQPLPSLGANADPELAAMFPGTIGGQPVGVQTYTARQLTATGASPATTKAIKAGLASVGKTLDDMTFGYSNYGNGNLTAVRVKGVDAASIEPQVLRLLLGSFKHPQQTPTKLHGRKVVKVTEGKASKGAEPTYFYASGDVLWEVKAPEPDLAEIMQGLP